MLTSHIIPPGVSVISHSTSGFKNRFHHLRFLTSQVGVSIQMYCMLDRSAYPVDYGNWWADLTKLGTPTSDVKNQEILKPLGRANHVHTWWYKRSPLRLDGVSLEVFHHSSSIYISTYLCHQLALASWCCLMNSLM